LHYRDPIRVATPLIQIARPRRVSGRDIKALSKRQRAQLAAEIRRGTAELGSLTLAQLSQVLNVSLTYIHHAFEVPPGAWADVLAHRKPLTPAPSSICAAWIGASKEERVAALRSLGPEQVRKVLDELTSHVA
jgi:hypothetical protein